MTYSACGVVSLGVTLGSGDGKFMMGEEKSKSTWLVKTKSTFLKNNPR
jgi:hypothetical protein